MKLFIDFLGFNEMTPPNLLFLLLLIGRGQAAHKMLFPRSEGTLTGPSGAQDTECFNTPVSGRSRELCRTEGGT